MSLKVVNGNKQTPYERALEKFDKFIADCDRAAPVTDDLQLMDYCDQMAEMALYLFKTTEDCRQKARDIIEMSTIVKRTLEFRAKQRDQELVTK